MSKIKLSSTQPVSVKASQVNEQKIKQSRLLQTTCPSVSLEVALQIPRAIKDNFAGKATPPLLVADACGIKPTSSNWRAITGAAVAYGLTNGACNAPKISITALGERIVAPRFEGDDEVALKEAALKPTVLADFYRQYDGNKMPKQEIAYSLLQGKGISSDRVSAVWEMLKANAKTTNMLRLISGSEYIFLGSVETSDSETNSSSPVVENDVYNTDVGNSVPTDILQNTNNSQQQANTKQFMKDNEKLKIFISHGKNSSTIVEQLKELLIYGQMEPVISVERETTAISVSDKVFDDMRACNAGIIHVDLEEIPYGNKEQKYCRLNENVLIEIGAAIALYEKRVVLLCKKDTELPSNLQGLYRCEYEGDQLDYASTMKLLKTMQELREKT